MYRLVPHSLLLCAELKISERFVRLNGKFLVVALNESGNKALGVELVLLSDPRVHRLLRNILHQDRRKLVEQLTTVLLKFYKIQKLTKSLLKTENL